MSAQNIFIIEPATSEQADALRAFAKALKIKFQISKTADSDSKKEILASIQQGINEVGLLEQGKQKKTTAKDFLTEL